MPTVVVETAYGECTEGSAKSTLFASIFEHGEFSCVGGKAVATVKDTPFFADFGFCKLIGGPCAYYAAGPWEHPPSLSGRMPGFTLDGYEALLYPITRLRCGVGGYIQIVDPGQHDVCVAEEMAEEIAAEKAALTEELESERKKLEDELREIAIGLGIDVGGAADPTPIMDVVGAINSLRTKDWVGAGLSVVSMIPYLGDAIAKPSKGAKWAERAKRITDVLDANRKLAKLMVAMDTAARSDAVEMANTLKTLRELKNAKGTKDKLDAVQDELDEVEDS